MSLIPKKGTVYIVDDDEAVDPLEEHPLGEGEAGHGGLAALQVHEQDVVLVLPKGLLDGTHDAGEEPPCHEGRDDPDQAAAS